MTPLPPQPLSPLDGRYRSAVGELGEHLSEAGLNRARVHVEVEWLIAQTDRGFFGILAADGRAEGARCARSSPTSASPTSTSSPRSRRPPATT